MSEPERKAEMRSDTDFAPLVEGLDNLRELVTTVRSLHRRTHTLGIISIVLVVVLIIVGVLGLQMWGVAKDNRNLAQDAKAQSEQLQEVVHDQRVVIQAQARERKQSMKEACQTHNSSNRATRQQFLATYRLIRDNSRTPEGKAFIQVLIDRVPDAQDEDTDCNKDEVLDRRDYLRF